MRNVMLAAAAALLCTILVLAAPAPKPAPTSELEGTKWTVKVVPDSKAAEKGESSFEDTIIFDGNKVQMTECAKYGFQPSPYSIEKHGEKLSFSTDLIAKLGKSVWSGDIKGNSIKGKTKWTKEDGTVLNYTFEGSKQ